MKKKLFLLALAATAIGSILLTLFRGFLPNVFTDIAAFPLEQIALGLRYLSQSGAVGNVIAIVLYVLISLIPLVLLLQKKWQHENWFLIVFCLHLFLALYCMINPGLIVKKMPLSLGLEFEKTLLGMMFYSFLLGYLIIRMVRSFFTADRPKLIQHLRILLGAVCFILMYVMFGSCLADLIDTIEVLQKTNRGNELLLGTSYVFLVLQYLLEVLPYALDVMIIFAVQRLLQAEKHSDEAVLAVDQLSRRCGSALVAIVISHAVYLVLQMIFLQNIYYSQINVSFPIYSLLFVLAVLLAAQYVRENKQLQEDNDLFI